jgi:MFS family permease
MTGFLGLCLARGLLGFGEGATFPAGLKAVTETLPAEQRSFGLGLAYSGGSLGALLTPLAITPLALRFGWQSSFFLSALVGFAWIAGWFLLRHLGLYRPVAPIRPPTAPTTHSRWNRDLFATAAVYGLGAAPLAFGLNMAPLYLTHVLHLPQATLGHLLWLPPAGWETGYLFWGRIADRRRIRAQALGVPTPSPIKLFTLFATASTAICLIPACAALPHAVAISMALFFLVMFLSGGYVVIALAHGATTQTAHNTGFLAGFSISGWSFITGLLMPVVGMMFDRGLYTASFWLVAALPSLGVVAWSQLSSPVRKSAP